MALLFCDGFDSYSATADFLNKWQINNSPSQAGTTFQSTGGRFGGGGTLTTVSSSGGGNYPRNLMTKAVGISTANTLYVGFWFKQNSQPLGTSAAPPDGVSINVTNGGTSAQTCFMGANSVTGNMVIYQIGSSSTQLGQGTHAICNNAWHWIEIAVVFSTSATGSVQTYVDGLPDINLTNVQTLATGQSLLGSMTFGPISMTVGTITSTLTASYDDVVIWDNTGTSFNTFPIGPQRITTLVPNADGDLTQFTPKTAGAHYLMVNGGYSSTNYVSDSGTGNVDLYKYPALSYSPTTVNAVVANYFAQNSGSGTANLTPVLKTGSTQISGATVPMATNVNTLIQYPWYKDATATAWTAATVGAVQAGIGD